MSTTSSRNHLILRISLLRFWHYSASEVGMGRSSLVEQFLLLILQRREATGCLAAMQDDLVKLNPAHDLERPLRGVRAPGGFEPRMRKTR
jgi:hypothetical protein